MAPKPAVVAAAREGANKKRKRPFWQTLDLDDVGKRLAAFTKALFKWVLLHHLAVLVAILALSLAYILRYHVKRVPASGSSGTSSSRSSRRNNNRGSSTSSGRNSGELDKRSLERAAAKAPLPLRLLDAVDHTKFTVRSVEYKVGGTFMRQLAEEGQPALIKNSPVREWDSFHWNLMELTQNNPDFVLKTFVKTDKNPVFIMGADRDKGGMLGSSKDVPMMDSNVPFLTFLNLTFDPAVNMFHLDEVKNWEMALNVTGTGTGTGTGSRSGSMGNWAALSVNEKALDDAPSQAHVHLAHPAMVLQTNFKTRHVVINQLQGYKRVIIFQPGAGVAAHEYLYPNIHRSYAYSQLHLEVFDADKHVTFFAKFGRKPAMLDVTLGPGDSLYIPPYWAVRQECITLSLAVHVESPSSATYAFTEAFLQQLPLGDFQKSQEMRSLGAALLLHDIVAKAAAPSTNADCISSPNMTLQRLAANIVENRFAPYMALHTAGKQLPKSLDKSCFPASIRNDSHIEQLLRNTSQAFDTATSRVVAAICRAPTHASIKERILMDYVEQLVRYAISPRYTGAYLIDCLSSASVMQSMLADVGRAL